MKNIFVEHLGPLLSKVEFYSTLIQLKFDSLWYPIDDAESKVDASIDRLYIPYFTHYQIYKIIHRLLKRYFYSLDMEKVFHENRDCILQNKISSSETGLMIIGSTGLGKTMLINLIIKLLGRPKLIKELNNLFHIPIVKVETPAKCNLKQLVTNILDKIEYINNINPVDSEIDGSLQDLKRKVQTAVRTHQIGMIIFDEIHNVSALGKNSPRKEDPKDKTEILNFFKTFSNDLHIPIIYVGTHDAETLLIEPQTSRRTAGEGKITLIEPHISSDDSKEEAAWAFMMKNLWEIQLTNHQYPLTKEIESLYYQKTLGIPDLIFKLHRGCLHKLIDMQSEGFKSNEITPKLVEAVSQDMPDYRKIVKSFPVQSTARKYLQFITSLSSVTKKPKRKTANKTNTTSSDPNIEPVVNSDVFEEISLIEITSNSNNPVENLETLTKHGVIKDLDSILDKYHD